MMIDKQKLLDILTSEIESSTGCTDPGSVCLAVAVAAHTLGRRPEKIDVLVSPNIYKNGVSVGIPGTIDNDLAYTEMTLGYDTAVNSCIDDIRAIRATSRSHDRPGVVEVMGRHAGYLALYVGVAVGATAVLVPEHQYDFEKHVAEKIRAARLGGKTNFMIVVAEGAASAMDVGKEIKEHLGLDPRVTILGHIQRGGSPTAKDRVLATRMGYEAVRVLAEGMTNRVICVRDDQIVNVDIDEGLAMKKTLNAEEFEVMTVMTGV